jgi:pseudomonalisin
MLSYSAIHLRSAALQKLLLGLMAGISVTSLCAQTSTIPGLTAVRQFDRIGVNADMGPQTRLKGTIPAWVQAGNEVAGRTVDLSGTIHVSMVLRRDSATQAAFEQLLADQQRSSSSVYHHWLSPQQVGQLFGPTSNDLAAIRSWLTSQGLKVDSIAPSGMIIEASGTIAVVGNAFHTSFGYFGVAGQTRLSAVAEPSIPTALTAVVESVDGLTEMRLEPMSRAVSVKAPAADPSTSELKGIGRPQLTITNGGVTYHFITPADFGVIYDVNSVYSGGDTGATIGSNAQHIAIIGRSRVSATDISEYATNTGITNYTLNTIIPTTGIDPGPVCPVSTATPPPTCATGDDQSEATLDVDRVIGTAPGAAADLVVSGTTNGLNGIYIAAAYNVNTLKDPIMTISFGACEAQALQSGVNLWDTLFSTAAAEGISVFVSSGDSGASGCVDAFTPVPVTTTQVKSINYICSSSYATCVGGTEFVDTANPAMYWSTTNSSTYESALSYIPEGAWNEPSTVNNGVTTYAPAASGGGVSAYIPKPTWQTGPGVPNDGFRDVPDVAFSASGHDGYYACLAFSGGDCNNGYFEYFSGTSAAAPSMAGVTALLNTRLGSAQGNVNPLLYRLAAATSGSPFHDVTIATSGVTGCVATVPSMCNNSTPGPTTLAGGLAGYTVTAGYDQVTGLGSIDVGALLSSVGSFTLAANPTTLTATTSLNTTTTSTSVITGTSTGGFVGTVALTCVVTPTPASGTAPVCAIAPSSLTLASGGTATSTLTITSNGGTSSCTTNAVMRRQRWDRGASGVALAGLLLLLLPGRRRKGLRALALSCLLAAGLGSLSGCGGSSSGTPCSNVVTEGTAPGTYTVTVTGTSGSIAATAPVTITVN